MHAARALAAVLLTLGVVGPPAVAADREAFARTIAEKLIAGKAKTRTHTTDFQGDSLGCITLTTWELRDLGYRGHAFFCEDAFTEEVLVPSSIGSARFAATSAGTMLATDAMTSRSAGSRSRCALSHSG